MSPLQLAPLSPTYKQLDPPCLYKSVLFSWRKIKLTYNYFECVKLSWNAQLGVVSVRIRVGVGFRLSLTLTLILTLLNLYQTLATLLTRNKLNSKLQANFTGFIILSFIHYWCSVIYDFFLRYCQPASWSSSSSSSSSCLFYMSPVMRKPVFGVCDQGRLKPASAATEAR